MSTFPAISGAQLIKALRRSGFGVVRVKGSHHFLQHPVVVHSQDDLFVDAGDCPMEPSTVVDLSGDQPVVLRQGRGVIDF